MSISAADVRPDITEAHRLALTSWAAPGSWWTSEERLAMVVEARRCRLTDELPAWVAPSSVDGLVDDEGPLAPIAVDVVWRLTRHPGTLTAEWHRAVIDSGLGPLAYLELVAVTAMAAAVDIFAVAVGFDPPPLPHPRPGRPSGDLPAGAEVTTHWVPTTDGNGPNVLRATSAVPHEQPILRALAEAHYVPADALTGDLTWSRETLDRRQIELIAARTSVRNDCFY